MWVGAQGRGAHNEGVTDGQKSRQEVGAVHLTSGVQTWGGGADQVFVRSHQLLISWDSLCSRASGNTKKDGTWLDLPLYQT